MEQLKTDRFAGMTRFQRFLKNTEGILVLIGVIFAIAGFLIWAIGIFTVPLPK